MEQYSWMVPAAMGLLGLVFGSFANVVIWRFPRGESVVAPGSHCPSCGHEVRWFDNIPVVSWIVLRARCRDCGARIAWRYPLVEALGGLLWGAAGARFGFSVQTIVCAALFYGLLILAFIDIDTYRLPNPLVAGLALLGAAGVLASQFLGSGTVPLIGLAKDGLLAQPVAVALLGAVLGAGVMGAIASLYGVARGRTGLGAGDIKLLAVMGLFTGPYVMLSLMVGSVAGSLFGIVAARVSGQPLRALKIPFGPFLAAGAIATVLWGPALWSAYLHALGLS